MNFNLDVNKVVSDMVQASAGALIKGGRKATEYATHEYAGFIADVEHTLTMAEQGTITEEEAQALVEQHKYSMQAVLAAVEGLNLIAAQTAINAAMDVLKQALSGSLQGLVKVIKL